MYDFELPTDEEVNIVDLDYPVDGDGDTFIKPEHYIAHLLERSVATPDVAVHFAYDNPAFKDRIHNVDFFICR